MRRRAQTTFGKACLVGSHNRQPGRGLNLGVAGFASCDLVVSQARDGQVGKRRTVDRRKSSLASWGGPYPVAIRPTTQEIWRIFQKHFQKFSWRIFRNFSKFFAGPNRPTDRTV